MAPSNSAPSERPIGYWLKAADRAITARVEAAQRADGVTRLEWQVLNTIFQAAHCPADHIASSLEAFLEDSTTLDSVLAELRTREWIEVDAGGGISLTDAGREAHARILARQEDMRQHTMRGISAEDYTTTIRVLKQIVANLSEPTES